MVMVVMVICGDGDDGDDGDGGVDGGGGEFCLRGVWEGVGIGCLSGVCCLLLIK